MNTHTFDDRLIGELVARPRDLPSDPVAEQIVMWRTFRTLPEAVAFAHAIVLGAGQEIVGGQAKDSLAALYWVGVHVDDLGKWGNSRAIQLNDAFDPESPEVQGRPFETHR